VENAKTVRVLEYEGSWKDLGTWETFTEEMSETMIGDAITGDSCVNVHVINELNIPTVLMGVKNAVVIVGHDGILVAEKGETQRLKQIADSLESRPMYEEKRWGKYVVLDHSKDENAEVLTKKLLLDEGQQISYQYHKHRKEVWTVISGKGTLYLDGNKTIVGKGDIITIETGIKHGLYANTEMELIEIQYGHPLIEDDINRLEMAWESLKL
jgi:mannose-1-phosphate guanylyltransferase